MNPKDIMHDAIRNFHPNYQQYTQYSPQEHNLTSSKSSDQLVATEKTSLKKSPSSSSRKVAEENQREKNKTQLDISMQSMHQQQQVNQSLSNSKNNNVSSTENDES